MSYFDVSGTCSVCYSGIFGYGTQPGNEGVKFGTTTSTPDNTGPTFGLKNQNPFMTTYAAATFPQAATASGTYVCNFVKGFDQNNNQIFVRYENEGAGTFTGRIEVITDGANARIYQNGVLRKTVTGLTQNPSFIQWGLEPCSSGIDYYTGARYTYIDDVVYGETENKFVLGLPESGDNGYIVYDDILGDSNDGVVFEINYTMVNANYMYGTWARGNASYQGEQPNQSIQLINAATKDVYAEYYTGTGYYGTLTINAKADLIDAKAPQGYYQLYMPGTGTFSNLIEFRSSGATVNFDKDKYSVGDISTVIYYVLDGGYWDPSLFSYKVVILDSYYQFKQNTTLTESSGTITYDFTEDDAEGVYHAWLIATNHDGYEYVLGSDYAELVAYFGYGGTVHDCITELPLSGVNVNVTQGLTAPYNASSGFDGNYTTGPLFTTGSSVFFNVTKSGYNPYQYSFVPLSSGTVRDLNLTICPSVGSGDTGGIGIGGVIRDATIGRPIGGANVSLYNQSNTQQYFKLTNIAGGYLCDVGTSCSLVSGREYAVNASKVGYNTSIDYDVVAGSA
jgi:hypothetical protein